MNYRLVSAVKWYNALSAPMKKFIFDRNGWSENYKPSGTEIISDFEEFHNNGAEFSVRMTAEFDGKVIIDALQFFKTNDGINGFVAGATGTGLAMGAKNISVTYKVVGYGVNRNKAKS